MPEYNSNLSKFSVVPLPSRLLRTGTHTHCTNIEWVFVDFFLLFFFAFIKFSKGICVVPSLDKFILPICKTKVATGGKRQKALWLFKSAAPSINNFYFKWYFTYSKIVKRKTETHVQQKLSNIKNTELQKGVYKKAELHKHNNSIVIVKSRAWSSQLSEFKQIKIPDYIYHQYQKKSSSIFEKLRFSHMQ